MTSGSGFTAGMASGKGNNTHGTETRAPSEMAVGNNREPPSGTGNEDHTATTGTNAAGLHTGTESKRQRQHHHSERDTTRATAGGTQQQARGHTHGQRQQEHDMGGSTQRPEHRRRTKQGRAVKKTATVTLRDGGRAGRGRS